MKLIYNMIEFSLEKDGFILRIESEEGSLCFIIPEIIEVKENKSTVDIRTINSPKISLELDNNETEILKEKIRTGKRRMYEN